MKDKEKDKENEINIGFSGSETEYWIAKAEKHKYALIFIAIASLVFFAWYGVSKYDEHVIKQESILFNAYIQNKDKKSATTQLKHLKDANTVYSVFASLFYAKQLFDKKKYAKAEEELKYVIKNTTNNLWKDNAYIYLASVYWQQNNPKKGIETLNMINEMNSYSYELRGDMYSELNNKKQALTNYQQAIDLNKENRIPDDDLVMKINNT